jgi:PAS domain S-box-containing protein
MPERTQAEWGRFLTQLLDSLPDPAMVTDLQGTIELANNKMLQMTGLSESKSLGKNSPIPG